MELALTDERIPIVESLASAEENRAPLTQAWAQVPPAPIARGSITITDAPIPAGIVLPDARLAVISASDLMSRMARHARHRNVDVTDVTFPFKPGDYVVHATHGIALFSQIVRQEVAGRERDYFLLEVLRTATSSTCRSSRWTASRATWAPTAIAPGSRV